MRRFIFLGLLVTLINFELISQSKGEIKNYFYDAESWILFEDYKEALPLYLQLLKIYPTNSNFKYRIGQCYINTPGEKEKAVGYLEDAVKNINPNYKEGKFRETGAPYDALYYLANAYRINNQIDKALDTYGKFKENLDPEVYDSTVVNLQIQSCLNARQLILSPLYVREKNLGSEINTSTSEFNPVISDNEDLIIYSKNEAFYDAILYSTKVNEQWTVPMNMNELLKIDQDLFPTSISKEGNELYLYSSADYDGIIYTTKFENGIWSPLVKLNDNINTKYWESHATISHDNKKIYFTSNRKGTIGGLDIYVSKRDSTGNWGPAENLGPVINTPYNEESPFLSKDDKTLFFSSRGHFNMGGYDIFYSTLLDNSNWSVPLNAGYPLNTTDDDVFFKPVNDGYEGYLAKDSPEGFGKQDIYRVELFSDQHPRKFTVKGTVKVAGLNSNINDSVRITARNKKNNATVVAYSNALSGEYEVELPQGEYELTYEGEGGEKITKDIDLALTDPQDSFVLPGTILPKTDFVADLNVKSNKNISVTNGDSILFPLVVEPKSTLTIEHWLGDSLVSSQQFYVTDSLFNYKMVPLPGDNKVVFKLTDRFNNTTSTDVFITRKKEIIKQPVVNPEYSHVIAKNQVAALALILQNRADDKLRKVIAGAHLEKQTFGTVDDIMSYLKDEAAKVSIAPEEIDKLALKVAVMDNILSQAAVDIMARYTTGELQKILDELDIYEANLKTWTDLQNYIYEKTGGKVTPEDLNEIAAAILADTDPSIAILRNKILAYGENSADSVIIRESVAKANLGNLRLREKWLQTFVHESKNQGLTENQLADLLVAISSMPGTTADEFLKDLIQYSDEPLVSALKSLNLKKERIRSPRDLVIFLLNDKNKDKYPEEAVLRGISNIIVTKDIPEATISSARPESGHGKCWIIGILIGLFIFFLIIIFRRRKKNRKN
jgi:hypothetical protein